MQQKLRPFGENGTTCSKHTTLKLGQLSLASLRGRLVEYQLRLGYRRECRRCRVAGDTV